jgi:light-regulated signal transduction histidine kinase (bacteriophytochrome)
MVAAYTQLLARRYEVQPVNTGRVVERVISDLVGAIEDAGATVHHDEPPTTFEFTLPGARP